MFQALSQVKAEINKLKDNIRKVEGMAESRTELVNLEKELPWAVVSLTIMIHTIL